MSQFIKATLVDGREIVSEFSKNQNVPKYAAMLFHTMRPFAEWHVVASTHPSSGESVLVRTNTLHSGRSVRALTIVVPIAGREHDHNYDVNLFVAKPLVQGGAHGAWTAPETNTPELAVAGVSYPIHIDPLDTRRYVIVVAQPETRFYLEAEATTSHSTVDGLTGEATYTGDADDDQ